MSYEDIEVSEQAGESVYLYQFAQGVTTWRFTNDVSDISEGMVVWQSSSIRHSEIQLTDDVGSDAVNIDFPVGHPFARDFAGYGIDTRITVTIFRAHRSNMADRRVVWAGYVSTPKISGVTLSIECVTLAAHIRETGLQSKMSRQCRHTLYRGRCGLNMNDCARSVPITAIDGRIVHIDESSGSIPAGSLSGGLVASQSGELRMITLHEPGVLTLARPFSALAADFASSGPGYTAQMYPGCARSRRACGSFLNPANPSGTNIENFGGFPWIPISSPFAGGTVL